MSDVRRLAKWFENRARYAEKSLERFHCGGCGQNTRTRDGELCPCCLRTVASALEPVDVEGIRKAVEDSLLQVAANVAKHVIQRDGWHADDKCFQVDLQAATERIVSEVAAILRREKAAPHRDGGIDDEVRIG